MADGGDGYPSVRISTGTVHPSNGAPADGKAVIAWEADWSGVAEVDYSLTGGTVGYQLLHWDASADTMNALQPRATGNSGSLHAYARVDPGDQFLLVVDNDSSWGSDRPTVHETVTAGSTTLPSLGDTWVFENEQSTTQNAGPWKDCARWNYMKSDRPYNYAYSDLGADFVTLDNISGGQWRSGTDNYPNVRVTDATLHPGHVTSDGQAVVAWEAQWDGFIDVDYRAWNGSVGYQLLQWDASAGEMRLLQERRTYSGAGGTGQLLERTRIERGDQILFVCDNNTTLGSDRVSLRQTVTVAEGPVAGDCWSFENGVSSTHNPAPWDNSARWRYMTSSLPIDATYTSLGDFADFDTSTGSQWQMGTVGYPSVRITDATLHPGVTSGQAVVAWEADFEELMQYVFEPSRYYTVTSVSYQVLQWDADEGLMRVLEARTGLDGTSALIQGQTHVGIGDYILFVLDNQTGNGSNDRTYFSARICVAPEPTSLALLALGALALVRRRRA